VQNRKGCSCLSQAAMVQLSQGSACCCAPCITCCHAVTCCIPAVFDLMIISSSCHTCLDPAASKLFHSYAWQLLISCFGHDVQLRLEACTARLLECCYGTFDVFLVLCCGKSRSLLRGHPWPNDRCLTAWANERRCKPTALY
jgi:hypothetical protein